MMICVTLETYSTTAVCIVALNTLNKINGWYQTILVLSVSDQPYFSANPIIFFDSITDQKLIV